MSAALPGKHVADVGGSPREDIVECDAGVSWETKNRFYAALYQCVDKELSAITHIVTHITIGLVEASDRRIRT